MLDALTRLTEVTRDLAALGEPAAMDDGAVLAATALAGDLRRLADAVGVQLASAVVERSEAGDADSLARRHGARSAGTLVAEKARIDAGTAAAWCAVGAATAPRVSLLGERLPDPHPPVADALTAGSISASAARQIITTLNECAVAADDAVALESVLVDHARTLEPRDLARLCTEVRSRYAPEGAEAREAALRARRGLRVTQLPDGMTRWTIDSDPESTGFLLTALDARTAPRRAVRFEPDARDRVDATGAPGAPGAPGDAADAGDERQALPADDRTLAQRRLDALVDLARESLAHDDGKLAGTSVAMVVTVPLSTLRTGLGEAHLAGVDSPVSASTARRLAATAGIIPAILGGPSEPLELGDEQRLFTETQRRAMAVRDSGCAWPGCNAPPGWCEAAHIHPWWARGRTDLENGVLLCRFHHALFDRDGWTLEWRDGVPWFTPPPWVDATGTARRGGRNVAGLAA
ncbi:DUF222 domain-containing protein [Galbitalea sp. SE-J8]|uniref:HNH endonuclease signature motif containing protein n=1 Tax=Galbitalea sp. SE-J8 TaxID=3054952 RepID=UPI00259CF59D|nr:HNH endonuclease signature motif containing protein [Galbitalea sp. SE-J8]MDM4762148.1 DUF222 domain-containing protein [Galbitalea sp. SE-J8]